MSDLDIEVTQKVAKDHARELIKQSVRTGSVALALQQNIFLAKDVLTWLVPKDPTRRTHIAYYVICNYLTIEHQYMDDGEHFLCKCPSYANMAQKLCIAKGGTTLNSYPCTNNRPSEPTILDNKTICSHIIEQHGTLIFQGPFSHASKKLVLTQPDTNKKKDMRLYCLARVSLYVRDTDKYNKALVSSDWIEQIRHRPGVAKLILKQIERLCDKALIYYDCVAKASYRKLVSELNKEGLLKDLDMDELLALNIYFPNIIDDRYLSYAPLSYTIATLKPKIAGYLLGYPVQNFVPSFNQIHDSLALLEDLGIQGYANHIKAYVKNTGIITSPNGVSKTAYANDQDVWVEDIDGYTPFDIIAYQNGEFVYRFTRGEFEGLLKTKKNPWTNERLPSAIVKQLEIRLEMAESFPPCRPLLEQLNRVSEDTLYETDDPPVEEAPVEDEQDFDEMFSLGFQGYSYTVRRVHNNGQIDVDNDNDDSESNDSIFRFVLGLINANADPPDLEDLSPD